MVEDIIILKKGAGQRKRTDRQRRKAPSQNNFYQLKGTSCESEIWTVVRKDNGLSNDCKYVTMQAMVEEIIIFKSHQ